MAGGCRIMARRSACCSAMKAESASARTRLRPPPAQAARACLKRLAGKTGRVLHRGASGRGRLPLSALADLVGLSPYHFARAFKRSFGVPPHRYHIGRRIERAKVFAGRTVGDGRRVGGGLCGNKFVFGGFPARHRRVTARIPSHSAGLTHSGKEKAKRPAAAFQGKRPQVVERHSGCYPVAWP